MFPGTIVPIILASAPQCEGGIVMGWWAVGAGVVAATLFYVADSTVLLVLAATAAIGSFWTFGIMHNYAMDLAKRRSNFTGQFWDITPDEADAVPNGWAFANFICSAACFVLFLVAAVMSGVRMFF